MSTPGGEFAYIDWVRRQTVADPRVLIGPGDDTAVLDWSTGPACLVTTDMLLEGSCFRLAEAGPGNASSRTAGLSASHHGSGDVQTYGPGWHARFSPRRRRR